MIYYISRFEVWLSLVEHYVRAGGAASSNLVTSTIENTHSSEKRNCAFFLRFCQLDDWEETT